MVVPCSAWLGVHVSSPSSCPVLPCPVLSSLLSIAPQSQMLCVHPAGRLNSTSPNGLICPRGQYQSVFNFTGTSCTPCPYGRYAPDPGSNSSLQCLACPPGFFSYFGAWECRPCSPGQYNPSSGSSSCSSSFPGYYAPANATAQLQCPPGKYTSSYGYSSCFDCSAGRYGSSFGQTSSSCTGACSTSAGYGCPAGSTSLLGIQCPPGTCSSCERSHDGVPSVQ